MNKNDTAISLAIAILLDTGDMDITSSANVNPDEAFVITNQSNDDDKFYSVTDSAGGCGFVSQSEAIDRFLEVLLSEKLKTKERPASR